MSVQIEKLSDEAIEAQCARLRQYAAILADFHSALISERLPADAARELVATWWESELAWESDS